MEAAKFFRLLTTFLARLPVIVPASLFIASSEVEIRVARQKVGIVQRAVLERTELPEFALRWPAQAPV
jgi:hypothetical protein